MDKLTELQELVDAVAAIDRRTARLAGNHASSAIHISGGGALAVVVGLVAIVCLIASAAIAWVGWQQTVMTQQQVQRLQEQSDMHQAQILRLNSKLEPKQ